MTAVPARVAWAVELLDVQPDDEILEFGVGPGVSISLVCERLQRGRMTAIDRSATAIERARKRNATHVASGRLELHTVELAAFDGEAGRYDKAFAVNVNVFWTTPAAPEPAVLRRVLRAGGSLLLVYGGPSPGSARAVTPAIEANLRQQGFVAGTIRHPGGSLVCVSAQPV